MFDINKFTYNEKDHLGFYEGVLVPSCTQLLNILYPLDPSIKVDVLENARERGTKVHEFVDKVNQLFYTHDDFEDNIPCAVQYATQIGNDETIAYVSVLSAYGLEPISNEELVFLLDEQESLVCYGHLDLIVKAHKTTELFKENGVYVIDLKRTSAFDKVKTHLQTHTYRIGWCQNHHAPLSQETFGIWLTGKEVKVMPLGVDTDERVIGIMKDAKGTFDLWQMK